MRVVISRAEGRGRDDAESSFHNADRPFAPLRFDPASQPDSGVSPPGFSRLPDSRPTGWPTRVIAWLRHDRSLAVAVIAPEQLDARGSRCGGNKGYGGYFAMRY